jgi:hypothetical protein
MDMTLSQILALVGVLDDSVGSETPRERFRRFLKENAKDAGQLRDYIQECLSKSGTQYNRALQDLVNYIAFFLEFEVVFGRYQGVQGQLGFDGHWQSPKDFHVVAEVKTTDAYTIKTATLTGYVDGLISEKKIPSWDNALGLYIVGRPDAELKQLENAIVAEKRTHQLRVISIESLLSLAELKSKYDLSHQDILEILRPSGPKIDPVVDLIAGLVAETQGETQPILKPHPVQSAGEHEIAKMPVGKHLESEEIAYWLTPVKSSEEETAEKCIERLVGKGHYYAFGQRTAGRKHMKAGDQIGFYATTKGVVAHAILSSSPEMKPRPDGSTSEDYPWVCSLKDVTLYLDAPIAIDAKLRQQLDAFKGRDPEQGWAWFVQATRKTTAHDFELLTGKSKNQAPAS